MKNLCITAALLAAFFISNSSFAQKEFNNWYFGNGAVLNFSSGSPKPSYKSGLYTDEGCTSVSDFEGNTLFYTNGVKVWDKTHRKMPNGYDLWGHSSATQSAIIVQKPGDKFKYYIFTVNEKANAKGLCYSMVDLTKLRSAQETRMNNSLLTPDLLPHYGRGDVTVKNKQLLPSATEKLTAVKHKNGKDAWIIAHLWNSNAYYVFPVTAEGVGAAVISKIGSVHRDYGSGNNGESIGSIKVSPNGKTLATAICYRPDNMVEIFDFDNTTGKITNLRNVPTNGYAYGVEFSSDNSKLYVSFLKGVAGIKQFDVSSDDLFESATTIMRNNGDNTFGTLQRGPDNKIYVARTAAYVDVINFPNKSGLSCKYETKKVMLGTKTCMYGLPAKPIINAKAKKQVGNSKPKPDFKVSLGEDIVACNSSVKLNPKISNASYLWSTGQTTPEIEVNKNGNYWVKVTKNGATASDTVHVKLGDNSLKVDLGGDKTLRCKERTELDANIDGVSYKWSTGETTQKIWVSESNYYKVTVSNGNCSATDRIYVDFKGKPTKFSYLKEFEPEHTFINNYFAFTINDVKDFKLKIFTSGGRLVFESDNPKVKWKGRNENGKVLSKGKYKWEISYTSICSGEHKTEKGEVLLKRL